MSTKLCIHCKHCSANFGFAACQRKVAHTSLVDGAVYHAQCQAERHDDGAATPADRCGPEGKFWEERIVKMRF